MASTPAGTGRTRTGVTDPPQRASGTPLRVALWVPVPPPLGGVARWGLRYVDAAARHKLHVHLLNISPPPGGFSERSSFRLDRLKPAGRALAGLARLLAHREIDVLHATTTLYWATPRDGLALALCKAAGVPSVLHIHASTQTIAWHKALPAWQRHAVDQVLLLATRVIVLSAELEAYLQGAVPGIRVARIGNMVEVGGADLGAAGSPQGGPPASLSPALAPLLPARTRTRVLFVGALTPLKGVTELAEAVLALPGLELVLIGGPGQALDAGKLAAQERALAALRQTGRLLELGERTPDEVLRAYREADLFCLPSFREGLPNVLLEAMAAGLPCVVTPVGGVPDVVAGDLAELVPVADVPALIDSLRRLAADPARRADLGARGQAAVQARYGVDTVMSAYRQLYEGIVTPRVTAPAAVGR